MLDSPDLAESSLTNHCQILVVFLISEVALWQGMIWLDRRSSQTISHSSSNLFFSIVFQAFLRLSFFFTILISNQNITSWVPTTDTALFTDISMVMCALMRGNRRCGRSLYLDAVICQQISNVVGLIGISMLLLLFLSIFQDLLCFLVVNCLLLTAVVIK